MLFLMFIYYVYLFFIYKFFFVFIFRDTPHHSPQETVKGDNTWESVQFGQIE